MKQLRICQLFLPCAGFLNSGFVDFQNTIPLKLAALKVFGGVHCGDPIAVIEIWNNSKVG